MQITFNGQSREIPSEVTVAQLLDALQLPTKLVAVEVNREVVPRRQHDAHILKAGDEVEVVTLVGGG